MEFNPNAFWYTFIGSYQYDAGHSKDTIIWNLYIRVAQGVLACGLFAWEDSLNVPHLSELYFLHSMLERDTNWPWFIFRQSTVAYSY